MCFFTNIKNERYETNIKNQKKEDFQFSRVDRFGFCLLFLRFLLVFWSRLLGRVSSGNLRWVPGHGYWFKDEYQNSERSIPIYYSSNTVKAGEEVEFTVYIQAGAAQCTTTNLVIAINVPTS